MASRWTEPAPKYGPTSEYGACEALACHANARVTCATCQAEVCLGHADHATHEVADKA